MENSWIISWYAPKIGKGRLVTKENASLIVQMLENAKMAHANVKMGFMGNFVKIEGAN